MGTVVIFGATGSVGVYSALTLKEAGYEVIALGHRKSDNGFFAEHGIRYYSVDVKNRKSFDVITERIDTVVHFAGAMPARMKCYNPYEYTDSIITGTLNVLEFMRERHCNKIVFSQSIADILYKFGSTTPIDDDVERRFPLDTDHSIYSISKNAAVNMIEHYHAKYGIQRFILRLPTIYVYQPNPFYYVDGEKRWMGYRYIIDQACKGNTLQIYGDPKSKKEMVYVKDFAQLVKCSVDSKLEGGIYNVGCGHPIAIEDQIRDIAEIFAREKKSEIVYAPKMPSSPQFVLNIEKARKELGYEPKFSFHEMMLDFKHDMDTEPFAKLWGTKEDFVGHNER